MYLGLPSTININNSAMFGYIKNNLQERIQAWAKRTLSNEGKETLLRIVAQSFLNYVMSVFLIVTFLFILIVKH